MKNRTIIGVVCMILAVVLTFAVSPLVNRLTTDTTEVLRLSKDIRQGMQITADSIEVVRQKTDTIPQGVINAQKDVVGKYAATNLYAGDYITKAKISNEGKTANDVFASLNGTKVAISVTVDSFAAGLSGKLENGDIISIFIFNKETGKTTIPGGLKYMKVITTTTAGGIDKDNIVKNDDGSFELPSTITVLANTEQSKLLAEYEGNAIMHVALVYRGEKETADKFLKTQDDYFQNNGGAVNE